MSRPVSSVRVFFGEIVPGASDDGAAAIPVSTGFGRRALKVLSRVMALSGLAILVIGCHGKTSRGANVMISVKAAPAAGNVVAPTVHRLTDYRPTSRIFDQFTLPTIGGSKQTTIQKVALTFDAGSDDSAVQAILAQLKAHQARATFFLTGRFCEEYPDSCRAIADAGMEIGNHSYSHPHFTKRKDAEIAEQLQKADAAISKACGRSTRPLFRFPYGDCNRRTRKVVSEAGYQPIGWTLDSLDSVGKTKTADYVANRIVSKIKPGYVILMHVSYPTSAAALPRIFEYLDKQHLQAVPVSDLLLAVPPPVSEPPGAHKSRLPASGPKEKSANLKIQSASR